MITELLLNYVPIGATIFITICYLPQILLLKKNKQQALLGISWGFWIMLNIALGLSLINAIAIFVVHGTYGVMVMESLNYTLSTYILFLMYKYRNKES